MTRKISLVVGLGIGLISVLVLAWAALIAWVGWVNSHRIVAGSENESAFYQSYDPEQVIKGFRYKGESFSNGGGHGALRLIKSIRHNEDFESQFTIQASRQPELLNALREDIMRLFRIAGMNVVTSHDQADGGFTYKYASGNSVGSISVQAPVHQMTERRYPVPSGLDDVNLKIALEETWTRPASQLRWWMSAVD